MGNNCKSCQCQQKEELLQADVRITSESKIKQPTLYSKNDDESDGMLYKVCLSNDLLNDVPNVDSKKKFEENDDSNDHFKEMILQHQKREEKSQIKTMVSKNQQFPSSGNDFQGFVQQSIQIQYPKRERREPYQFNDGAIYEGEWTGSMRDGVGTQTWVDGSQYTGSWKNNKANGHGHFLYANGDEYEGHWENDQVCGLGVYQHKNGSTYSGSWKNGLQDGKGIETWADGSRFEGIYSKGLKEGFGIYEWSDGSIYKGQWAQNEIEGIGHYILCNGRSYQGHCQNNMMHGRGFYKWEDGRSYDGQYSQDKKTGYGIYTWPDGRRYEGYWKDGKQHGISRLVQQDGQYKYGQWQNGVRLKWLEEGVGETQFVKPQGWDEQKIVVKEILQNEDARLSKIDPYEVTV